MIRGVFASHMGIVGDRVGDLASRVLTTMPGGSAPLLALSSGMKSEKAVDTSFGWIEDTWMEGNTQANGAINSSATTLVVDDSNIWTKNTVIMNEATGEYMLVTAISGNSCTVVRGISGTTAAGVSDNDRFQSLGTAFAEGSGKPDAITQRGHPRTNYVQIFKNAWAITGTAKAVKFHTGSQLAQNREQCANYHVEDIERAFLFGKKHLGTLSGQQLRLSHGITAQITDYGGIVEAAAYQAEAGEMSLWGLMNFLRRIFDVKPKGYPNERIAFTSSTVVELIQQMVHLDSEYKIEAKETEFGIRVMKLIASNGELTLMTHPMMINNALWKEQLYVLHPGLIQKRILRDSWTEEFNTEAHTSAGVDADEGYIAIEMGFQVKGARCMGIMTDITTAAPSVLP